MPRLHKLKLNLRSVHGKYLCAEGGGGRELVANRSQPDAWESFDADNRTAGGRLRDGDRIALQANNGRWVYAANGGGGQLLAKGQAIGDWEPLTIRNLDAPGGRIRNGTRVALQVANGRYVYAEPGGRVVAAGPAIGDWEPFTAELFSISVWKSVHGRFLCAVGGGGSHLVADRESVDDWELFRFHFLDGWPLRDQERCALRAHGKQYVYAHRLSGAILVTGEAVGDWEPLRVYIRENPQPDIYRVELQTVLGTIVFAQPNGRVSSLGNYPAWEPFELEFPDVLGVG